MNDKDMAGVLAGADVDVVAKALAKAPQGVLAAQLVELFDAHIETSFRVREFVEGVELDEIADASADELARLLAHVLEVMDFGVRLVVLEDVLEAS